MERAGQRTFIGKIVSTSEQVEVMVLDVDLSKEDLSVSNSARLTPGKISATYPIGTGIEAKSKHH